MRVREVDVDNTDADAVVLPWGGGSARPAAAAGGGSARREASKCRWQYCIRQARLQKLRTELVHCSLSSRQARCLQPSHRAIWTHRQTDRQTDTERDRE